MMMMMMMMMMTTMMMVIIIIIIVPINQTPDYFLKVFAAACRSLCSMGWLPRSPRCAQ